MVCILQPKEIKAFVDKVVATPFEQVADALDGFTWDFEKVSFRFR